MQPERGVCLPERLNLGHHAVREPTIELRSESTGGFQNHFNNVSADLQLNVRTIQAMVRTLQAESLSYVCVILLTIVLYM